MAAHFAHEKHGRYHFLLYTILNVYPNLFCLTDTIQIQVTCYFKIAGNPLKSDVGSLFTLGQIAEPLHLL